MHAHPYSPFDGNRDDNAGDNHVSVQPIVTLRYLLRLAETTLDRSPNSPCNRPEITEIEPSTLDVYKAHGFRGTMRIKRRPNPFSESHAQHAHSVPLDLRLHVRTHTRPRFQWWSSENYWRHTVISLVFQDLGFPNGGHPAVAVVRDRIVQTPASQPALTSGTGPCRISTWGQPPSSRNASSSLPSDDEATTNFTTTPYQPRPERRIVAAAHVLLHVEHGRTT